MRVISATIMILLLIAATPARADSWRRWTGNTLIEKCPAGADVLCRGYVMGFADAVDLEDATDLDMPEPRLCIPDHVDDHQLWEVVRRYMIEQPERRDQPARFLVSEALDRTFRCPAKQDKVPGF